MCTRSVAACRVAVFEDRGLSPLSLDQKKKAKKKLDLSRIKSHRLFAGVCAARLVCNLVFKPAWCLVRWFVFEAASGDRAPRRRPWPSHTSAIDAAAGQRPQCTQHRAHIRCRS